LHRKRRNAILLEAGFADAAAAVKLPIVPGADDEFAVQPTVAKRPADMVARVRYGAEFPVLERDGELPVHRGNAPERRRGKLFGGTNIDPVVIFGHDDPVPQLPRSTPEPTISARNSVVPRLTPRNVQ